MSEIGEISEITQGTIRRAVAAQRAVDAIIEPDEVEPLRQINLRVDPDLLARIERARGDVPRERFLRRVIDEAIP